MIVNKSMFPLQTGFGVVSKMQDKFAELQIQLGTGQKSSTLSGMGRDLPLSLSVRSRLNTIDGFTANIEAVQLRLTFIDNALTRFDKMEGEARNAAIPGQYGTGGINMATSPGLSSARFDEIVTMLNQDVAGRYVFGGKITDKQPLENANVLMDGEGGRLGYKAVAANRGTADGVGALGRLEVGTEAAGVVTLGEDGAHPFGFKVSTVSTNAAPAVSVTQPTGAGQDQVSVSFPANPLPGQSVTIGLTLPDGTETQLTLTATTDENPAPGQFRVDADPAQTALNFGGALRTSLTALSQTELKAASAFAAATDFFAADGVPKVPSSGTTPTDYANATSLVDASASEVIGWYKGGTDADPRGSVSATVEEGTRTRYGVQANESGFLQLIRSQAALSIGNYPSEESIRGSAENEKLRLDAMKLPEGADRTKALADYEASVQAQYRLSTGYFDGMASRQQSALSEGHNTEAGSIEIITMDMGLATAGLGNAKLRHAEYKTQLDNLLSDVETVSKEDVAMEIMALNTRLTASYQATAMISQLSLVKFI